MMQQSIMCGSCSTKLNKFWQIKCTKCGKVGHHYADKCPKKNKK